MKVIIFDWTGVLYERHKGLFDFTKEVLDELKTKYNTRVMPIKTDLSSKQSIKNLFSKVIQKFSRIDVLINNAMFHENKKELTTPFEEYSLSNWNKVIDDPALAVWGNTGNQFIHR